ncbi:hypothetical protein DMP05_05965 [Slackia isoflavoniconvertens]|uniref:Uncharacterized protein n=1 Tax=Slackia isoflavoniconvertens TaxID=572010 RepID=A0A3N0IDG8_9ACTN|nr:hypothetical protein DMP05_05965 [Slackia isoflavoniconvertens]
MGRLFLFVERCVGRCEAMDAVVFSAGVACFLRWYSAELVVIFCQVEPNYFKCLLANFWFLWLY